MCKLKRARERGKYRGVHCVCLFVMKFVISSFVPSRLRFFTFWYGVSVSTDRMHSDTFHKDKRVHIDIHKPRKPLLRHTHSDRRPRSAAVPRSLAHGFARAPSYRTASKSLNAQSSILILVVGDAWPVCGAEYRGRGPAPAQEVDESAAKCGDTEIRVGHGGMCESMTHGRAVETRMRARTLA